MVKISRMERMMVNFPNRALDKFLSNNEKNLVKSYQTASGFWAVKEAVSKALGVGIGRDCSFLDIIISKTDRGAPQITLSEKIVKKFNIIDTSVSIAHHGEYAIAVVAIEIKKT